jgi:hypothetical protein
MHKNAMKCNKTLSKWYKNKHGASKIIDTLETYQTTAPMMAAAASIGVTMAVAVVTAPVGAAVAAVAGAAPAESV